MSPTEPVASKKSLFEAGEAWSQNPVPVTPSKVVMMLTDDVNFISRVISTFYSLTSSGKRHKFVVTGHGKYEKVSAPSI
uniref:Uncharacterized protein n=1 Tax=Monopterus albus TaxID=43700 RepID=A0A3Q3IGR2_MONAL